MGNHSISLLGPLDLRGFGFLGSRAATNVKTIPSEGYYKGSHAALAQGALLNLQIEKLLGMS